MLKIRVQLCTHCTSAVILHSFYPFQKPLSTRECHLNKFSLGFTFLFRVLTSEPHKDDLIDFVGDFQKVKVSAQVKRKLENPEYRIVTATLVHTEKGAKIVVQGIDDPTSLSEDEKDFIRIQIKEVVLQEIAISKTWGKIPSVQATFQLGIGNFSTIFKIFKTISYKPYFLKIISL